MRVLRYSRERGRAARHALGDEREALEERLRCHLTEKHQITIEAVSREFLRGGKGEIAPQEKTLYYWRSLDRKPQERLWVIAHEYGHLICHQRLTREATVPDPIHGSYLVRHGTGEISRYSPRSREEAEANAFAAEFLAPANEVFRRWQDDAGLDSSLLAERLGVPVNLVRAQLAQALYDLTMEEDAETKDAVGDVLCDEKQEEAAICVDNPLLVNAGPGTGKTKTLVRRIEHLVVERKAPPETLLALTFSNDAAEELRVRVSNKLGEHIAQRIEIATFHGFGRSFLDRHGHLQGLSVDAQLIDDAGQEELLSDLIGSVDCYNIVNLRNPGETVAEIARHIRFLKDRLVTPEAFASHLAEWEIDEADSVKREEAEAFARLYSEYEVTKRNKQIIDFADLLAFPIRILKENLEVKTLTQDTYRWIMVDEYQDVSRAVAILLKEISRRDSPPWVVGDIRQAIYLFRGAAPENVLRFSEDFEGGINKLLRKNYRSATPIISVANQLATLMNSPDHSTAEVDRYWEAGTNIRPIGNGFEGVITANCDAAERDAVAQQIKHWIDGGVNPGNIAVLARRNIDVRNTVLELSTRGVRASASGVVTAEGAAGDLAAASIFIDRPKSCIIRLAFALGRGRFKRERLNELVSELLEKVEKVQQPGEAPRESSMSELSTLHGEITRFAELAEAE
ncbi:MAG TPA: ATP-dependent helicase, partial [Blastocatellia bacterium]|nr:ATP-dependent helicase [Blastocatellia bacterium]